MKDNKINLGFFARFAVPFAISALKNAVYLINIRIIREYLKNHILRIIEDIADILTDDNDDNAEQIKLYFANNWKVICAENLVFIGEVLKEYNAPEEIAQAVFNASKAFDKYAAK
jgi:hypothetical protein